MTMGLMTSHQLMISETLLILIAILALIFCGNLADIYSPKKMMQWSSCALIILAYPLLAFIDKRSFVFISMALLIFMNEMLLAPSSAYLKNLFAVEYRYRAVSLSFGLGMSVIGGLTPIVENFLYHLTGHFQAASIWLIFISICTFFTMHFLGRKKALEQNSLILSPSTSIDIPSP